MAKDLINDIKSDSPEWVKAHAYFKENPSATKLSRAKSHLDHSFINIDGKIYAMANKKQGHLGEGYHAVVKLVQTQTGENFALRIEGIESEEGVSKPESDPYTSKPVLQDAYLQKPSDVAIPNYENTMEVLKKLNRYVGGFERILPGPQIQKLAQQTVKQISKKHYTIEPWVEGDSLTKSLAKNLSFSQRLIIAQKSMQALDTLHKKGVIHADVHSENMIMDGYGNKTLITLIDMGLSKILPPDQLSMKSTPAGRKGFIAPEIKKQGIYSFASDVYALGKMLQDEVFDEDIPAALHDLIHDMTKKDPEKRPTLEQAQHRLQEVLNNNVMNIAIASGDIAIVKQLVSSGYDINQINENDESLLNIAIKSGQNEIAKYLMGKMTPDQIFRINKKGEDARDVAINSYNIEILALFENEPSFNLGQSNLNDRLTHFLQMNYALPKTQESDAQPFKPEDIIEPDGNCNGWGMLYQVYRSKNMEAEFYDILKILVKWDKQKNSLQTMPLPPSLYEKYGTLQNLLGAVCNNLAMFHANRNMIRKMNINLYDYGQASRIKQYNLMKDSTSTRELTKINTFFNKPVNIPELIKHLKFMAHFPGTSVDIQLKKEGQNSGHEVTIYITPNGEFQYYDSNIRFEIPIFNSAEECADFIMQRTIKPLRYQNKNGEFILRYDIYQFHDTPNTVLSTVSAPNLNENLPNFNNYNALHYAVLENNVQEVQRLLKEKPELANKHALDDNKPIHLALNLKNEACFSLLLNAMNNKNDIEKLIDFKSLEKDEIEFIVNQIKKGELSPNIGKTPESNILTAAIMNGSDNAVKILLSSIELDVDKYLTKNHDIMLNMNIPLSKLKILASVGSFVNNAAYDSKTPLMIAIDNSAPGAMTTINILLSNKNLDINIKDNNGYTALMHAVIEERFDLVKLLLLKNPDLLIKDIEGKTVMQHITDKLNAKDPPLTPEKAKYYQYALSEITTYIAKNNIKNLSSNKENILAPLIPQKSLLGQYKSIVSKSKEKPAVNTVTPSHKNK